MKVLINCCYGGFSYSPKAIKMYLDAKGIKYTGKLIDSYSSVTLENRQKFSSYDISHDDPTMIQIFEEIGSEECSGDSAQLRCIDIPDGCKYEITEHDGWESLNYWLEATFDEVKDGLSPEKLDIFAKCGTIKLI